MSSSWVEPVLVITDVLFVESPLRTVTREISSTVLIHALKMLRFILMTPSQSRSA